MNMKFSHILWVSLQAGGIGLLVDAKQYGWAATIAYLSIAALVAKD